MRETAALLGLGRRMVTGTDAAPAVEVRLELRLQGHALGAALQEAAQARASTSRRSSTSRSSTAATCAARAAGSTSTARSRRSIAGRQAGSPDQRRQEAGQQLLRHPRRRAVHAPGAARHPRAAPGLLLPVFTNGQFITDAIAAKLRALGNVTPLVSIEGTEIVSDERRGQANVLTRTLAGLDACIRHKLITGVATSVCQTNIDDLLQRVVARRALIELGVHLHLVPHLPPGRRRTPSPGAGLTPEQVAARAAVRRRDAGEDADRPRSTPTRTTRARRCARWPPASATTSTRGATSSRARSSSSRRRASTTSATSSTSSTTRPTSATSASWRRRPRAAASCSSGRTW